MAAIVGNVFWYAYLILTFSSIPYTSAWIIYIHFLFERSAFWVNSDLHPEYNAPSIDNYFTD